jgi:hypothetical protein
MIIFLAVFAWYFIGPFLAEFFWDPVPHRCNWPLIWIIGGPSLWVAYAYSKIFDKFFS